MKPKLLISLQNSFRSGLRPVTIRLLLVLTLCPAPCALSHLAAQVPQGFNYQAIARDGSNPIDNGTIDVQVSILTDTAGFYLGSGNYVWEEQHTGVQTNAFGLFSLVVGTGPLKIQGTAASFAAIDWSVPLLYIGTKIRYMGTWKIMGASKLWSVPYSMFSDTAKSFSLGSKLAVVSDDDFSPDALFEVRRKDGQPVFSVYNEGVRVYVDDLTSTKGPNGGFAIGGFTSGKGAQDYFVVNSDSIRAYIDTNPG